MDSMKKIIREMNPELRAKIEKTLQMLHIKVSERTTQEAIREKVGEILVKHPEDITRSLGETTHFLESLNIQAMDAEKSLAILGSLLEKIPAETLISNISSSRNAKLKTWIENAFPGMSWEKGEIPALLKIAEMSRGKTIAELRTADSPLARSHQAHYIKIVNASSNTETNSVHPLQLAYYTYAHDVFFRIQREISPGKALSEESRITLEKILGNKEFRSSKLE